MSSRPKFQWWVPWAKYGPETVAEIRRVYTPMALLRITCAVILVVLLIAYVLPRCIPNLDVDWVALTVKALLFGAVAIVLSCGAACVPCQVTIRTNAVQVSQRERSHLLKYSDLAEVRIEAATDRSYLLVLRSRSTEKVVRYGVPRRIPMDALAAELQRCWGSHVKVVS